MLRIDKKKIEIRAFLHLSGLLKEKYGSNPLFLDINKPISGTSLANKLKIPREDIEVIFVNGLVQSLDYIIHPGDRVAFLPPGCPGPYRIALGFYGKNRGNDANFKL